MVLDLIIAAALAQGTARAPDPCYAVDPAGPRPAGSCPAWQAVDTNPMGATIVDPASLRREGPTFQLMTRVVLPADRVFPGDRQLRVRSINTQMRYDCAGRTYAAVHVTAFDARGVPVLDGARTGDSARARPAVPGSAIDEILNRFCTR